MKLNEQYRKDWNVYEALINKNFLMIRLNQENLLKIKFKGQAYKVYLKYKITYFSINKNKKLDKNKIKFLSNIY